MITRVPLMMKFSAVLALGAAILLPTHSADARKGGGDRPAAASSKFSTSAPRSGSPALVTKRSPNVSDRVTRDHRGEAPKRQAPNRGVRPCRQGGQVGGSCDRYNRPLPVRDHRGK